ncbi:AAA family ATPase [Microbulbifer hydrolyticus]|uniref:AAA domain-containing protein n=1 Tax=Microbulbifer hydrolyticus TaxID=48074 RepID=A0ABX6J3I0_9GAMM|nr:AAA family ATPase [Microbulbifer hydrolyticus]QHQ40845.1 AAA domain-containing protein [Microbulbifer hydrolyticus]
MQKIISAIVADIGKVLLGKDHQVKLALACLLARGHLLIEDLPGMGKTTLAHALAQVLGLSYKRVQFTSDMLPADILGVSIFERESGQFRFHEGPVFSQLLLADEINRSSPKTQSALLEAMEERQVSIDGETRPLPEPFFVIATQNPLQQSGTFALPESQLDRFLMRISLGYPTREAERALFQGIDPRAQLAQLKPRINGEGLRKLQSLVGQVKASESLLDYLERLVQHSRQSPDCGVGLSPRGALALLHAARAWALIHNRGHLLPEDLQAVLPAVAGHRLQGDGTDGVQLVERIMHQVDIIAA